MACTVSQRDIREQIGGELQRAFPSAVRTSYTDRLAIYIPYDAANPNQDVLYGKVKNLEKKLNSEYHSETYGNSVSFNQSKAGVEFNIHPSKALATAMSQQNAEDEGETLTSLTTLEDIQGYSEDFIYAGEIYASQEDMDAATLADEGYSFMPANGYTPTNYSNFIEYKQTLLKKIEKRLANAVAGRKFNKSVDLKSEISKLNNLKDKLDGEIYALINDPDIFERTMSVFNSDIALIDTLLSSETPSIENIQLAQDMVTYFDLISDYTSTNGANDFIDVSDINLIEPEIKSQLDKLRTVVMTEQSKINKAKQQYLLQAIDESQTLKSLFPSAQLEEIREKLLENKSDISMISWLFGTVDKEFSGQDSLLGQLIRSELENSRNKNKAFAADKIQQINDLEGRVKSKLIAQGYSVGYKAISYVTLGAVSEVNYGLFYQKGTNGNKTGRLVHKYSEKWFKDISSFFNQNQQELGEAFQSKDYDRVNTLLVNKYNWLNERTDILDLTKLPELINNPDFSIFSGDFNSAEAENYKAELIAKIGEYNYNELVKQQQEHLEDYLNFATMEQQNLMALHGVSTMAELPDAVKHQYNITIKRNDPFDLINSHKEGQQGRVDYIIGNTGNQYQSQMKYNSYIPKDTILKIEGTSGIPSPVDSGYYDPNFKEIETDPDLLRFWEVMSDSASFMNSTINDANTTLSHNSLLKMSQSMTDILLNKNTGVMNKTVALLSDTGQTMKNLFATRLTYDANGEIANSLASDVEEVNKGGIETIQAEVNQRYDIFKMQLGRTLGKASIDNQTKINLRGISIEAANIIEKLTGSNIIELSQQVGNEIFIQKFAKDYLTNQVMEEQTFNLPVMMKAYLDIVSEYKAQKDALPKINIFKDLYNNIKLAKKEKRSGILNTVNVGQRIREHRSKGLPTNSRVFGQIRAEHWINKNVKGLEDKEYWKTFGKNLNQEEVKYKEEAELYLKFLEDKIEKETDPDRVQALSNQADDIKYKLQNLGLTYTAAAAYNTVVNRMAILIGLGFNIPSQVFNRFQGWYQGMINDTGRYWTAGNFYESNAFINRKGLKKFIPSLNNEIKKTKLMMEKLNIIQDATNELDRARRGSGLTGFTSKFNPFYLTEYVEWHNQTPQILAILMDHRIKDDAGNEVQIFDGSSFPAYNIEDGTLVLKDQYRSPENVATWEDFSNNESSANKSKISTTIAVLNGDYSKTGSTYIKSKTFGKTIMMFKTWLPNQVFLRFATNQTDTTLGLDKFEGAYTGTLNNRKTLLAGSVGVGGIAAVAGLGSLGLGFGLAIPAALGIYAAYQGVKAKREGENLEAMKQLSGIGQAIIKKAIGIPVNTISGKNLIKAHTFNELSITPADRQNLNFIVNELVGLLWLTLFKVLIKGMLGDDKDKEPKTLGKGVSNPYYPGTEKDETTYNVLENTITRMIDEASLYINPTSMKQSMLQPAGIDGWLKKAANVADAVKRQINGEDILQTGPNAGQSKTGHVLGSIFLPGVMNEWVHGDSGSFGFGKYKQAEWNRSEYMDSWSLFNSDFKLAKKEAKSDRAKAKAELTEYWNEELGINKEQDPVVKEQLEGIRDKTVTKELNITNPLNLRVKYNEDQEEIE